MATLKRGWIKKVIDGVSTKVFPITHVKSIYYNYTQNKTLADKLNDIDAEIESTKNKVGNISVTKESVTDALGYTPYTPNEIDNKFSALETNIDWKEAVDTYDDIATTYPNPEDGWTVNVKDTDYTYRYNGTEWVPISANAIPKATNSVDGLMSKEDYTKVQNLSENMTNHVNDTNNPHSLTKEQIGLGNVDNTSDLDKPISTAMQSALDSIVGKIGTTDISSVANTITGAIVALSEASGGDHNHTSLTNLTSLQFAAASDVTDSTTPIISTIRYLSGYVGSGTAVYGTALTVNTSLVPTEDEKFSLGIDGKTWESICVHTMHYVGEINFSEASSSNQAYIKCYQNSNISQTTLMISSIIPYASGQYFGTINDPWEYGYFTKINLVADSSNYATIYASTYTSSGVSRLKLYVGAAICPSNPYTSSLGLSDNAWNNVYAQQIYSTGGAYGFHLNGGVFIKGNLYPLTNNGYSLGNTTNLFSGIYGSNVYTKAFETDITSDSSVPALVPPATLNSSYSSRAQVGTQAKPFKKFYASEAYHFTNGTWWNGISFTESTSVTYGSSGGTTSTGKTLTIGESGLQLLVSTSVASFTCTNGAYFSNGSYSGSDEKIKTFTNDVSDDLSMLVKLFDIIKLRSFKYRYKPDSILIGVNAEELESDMYSVGLDPSKYGILQIEYDKHLSRGDTEEDDKFYSKFISVSYERLATLAIAKIQDMERTHVDRLNSLEQRLLELEQKG